MSKAKPPNIRDRIKELRRVPAKDILPNPKNWRTHPESQRKAMAAMLAEIGYADALLVRELPDGQLMLINGELRKDTTPAADVPVLVLDVTEAEADKLLRMIDPLAAMAETDDAALASLDAQLDSDSEALAALLAKELPAVEGKETELRPISTKAPPKMSWVLVGIPTVEFGSIAALVDKIAAVESTIVETTINDG